MVLALFDWKKGFERLAMLKKQREEEAKMQIALPKPPNPYFKEITENGKVVIGFDSEIYVVPSMTMINNGTIYLDELDIKHPFFSNRKLLAKKEKERIPVLTVDVIPGLLSNATALGFKWNATTE